MVTQNNLSSDRETEINKIQILESFTLLSFGLICKAAYIGGTFKNW